MKMTYPLSLKVSLWLLLNLLLLAALGIGFFIAQGGLRWGALVAGVAGDRAQARANMIAGEVAAATRENRDAVLARFGEAYRAELFIFRSDGGQVAGPKIELPADVRERVEFRPPGRWPRGDGPSRGDGPRGEGTPPDEFRRFTSERTSSRREPPVADASERAVEGSAVASATPEVRRDPSPTGRRETEMIRVMPSDPSRDRERSFVVRTGSPAKYWVGLRVPFVISERTRSPGGFGFGGPPMLLVRLSSFWSLLRFLDLEPWLLAGTAVFALSIIFWLPLVSGITRALSQLTLATERIAEGRFDTRVPTGRRDEIGRLGESVNRMATRIDAHVSGQKRFLGDVAHELCSPLARMQMATGILAEQAPPALAPTVADVREEVQHMSSLVNELLAFTKAGLRPRDVTLSAVELEPLLQRVIAREEADHHVTVNLQPALKVIAEPDLLERAVANLVRNAVRYAGQAGAITLSARAEHDSVVISVEDEGPGVPPDAIDRLGDPFFRPESARTRESGGVGLGLSIVRGSVGACGGTLRFANRTPRGFVAEIRLKRA